MYQVPLPFRNHITPWKNGSKITYVNSTSQLQLVNFDIFPLNSVPWALIDVIIDQNNGLTPNRWRAIIWTKYDPVQRHISLLVCRVNNTVRKGLNFIDYLSGFIYFIRLSRRPVMTSVTADSLRQIGYISYWNHWITMLLIDICSRQTLQRCLCVCINIDRLNNAMWFILAPFDYTRLSK